MFFSSGEVWIRQILLMSKFSVIMVRESQYLRISEYNITFLFTKMFSLVAICA